MSKKKKSIKIARGKKLSKKTYVLSISVRGEEEKDFFSALLQKLGIINFVLGSASCDINAEYAYHAQNFSTYESFVSQAPIQIFSFDREELISIEIAFNHALNLMKYNLKPEIKIEDVKEDWQNSWKDSFKPILVGKKIAILPPWEKNKVYATGIKKIIINPGMAFGTGQHETTRLCLERIINEASKQKKDQKSEGLSLLDIGTGSGILCLAAEKMGFKKILGIDIDPLCLTITKKNLALNSCHISRFKIIPIQDLPKTQFDIVVANIQAEPLRHLIDDIVKRTKLGGLVILSGILLLEAEDFVFELKKKGLKNIRIHKKKAWVSLSFQKK